MTLQLWHIDAATAGVHIHFAKSRVQVLAADELTASISTKRTEEAKDHTDALTVAFMKQPSNIYP